MRVSDIMTTDRFTVTSDKLASDVEEQMRGAKVRHVLVVDDGKLVGVVSRDSLPKAAKSLVDSLMPSDLINVLPKLTAKDIMVKQLVTVTPDTMIEKAVALAQEKKVGVLPVVQRDRVFGIVTNDDFFKSIINPILGIGLPGARITLYGNIETKDRLAVVGVIAKHKAKVVIASFLFHQWKEQRVWTLHLDVEDASNIVEELRGMGYTVEIRER